MIVCDACIKAGVATVAINRQTPVGVVALCEPHWSILEDRLKSITSALLAMRDYCGMDAALPQATWFNDRNWQEQVKLAMARRPS